MKVRDVYLDHAATTPLALEAQEAMKPFMERLFGNPSSFHSKGKEVLDELEDAHTRVAQIIGSRADEIVFTSGGTESDNLAMLGLARAHAKHGKHIISSNIEHPAIHEALYQLERHEGFEVTYIDVDKEGIVKVDELLAAIREDTILVNVMLANNEIGTIQPVGKIGSAIKKLRGKKVYPVFHTDACQALGALEVDVAKLHVDMMTFNSSKVYGPKGVGALYVRRGLKLQPLQFGGSQEKRIRPGTENIIGIMGFVRALEVADQMREAESARLTKLRDYFIKKVLSSIPKTRLNGHQTKRLPNNINISFMDIEGEALILYLDSKGVYVATGSACTSATLDPSHVIIALGMPYEVAHGSIRFTMGRSTTKEDLDYVLEVLPELVERLRKISPVRVDEKYFT